MSNRKPANQGPTHLLPERANLEHLRNEAKQRLKAMRIDNPGATLASAQLATARLYGFTSWRRLVAYVKAQRDEENQPRQPSENPPQSFSDGLKEEATSAEAKAQLVYDEAAQGVAHNKFAEFQRRTRQLAMMTDTLKAQEVLSSEYGIQLSVDEIRMLQQGGLKFFNIGVIKLWVAKQPWEALGWVASTLTWPQWGLVDFHLNFLNEARKTLPNLNRDTLDAMLPEGPGKAQMLDLADAATDPYSLGNRILAVADHYERASRFKVLAQGWDDPEIAFQWARQNLSGSDKTAFYSLVGGRIADQNPQAALQILVELKEADAYAFTITMIKMMRGLVQINGQGQQAAELILNADLDPNQRAKLISDLIKFWVRQNADAAMAWGATLTAPEDVRAAIPHLIYHRDSDQIRQMVEAYLESHDPVIELALIESAKPREQMINPQKSRLIIDLLLSKDPGLKAQLRRGMSGSKEERLFSAVNAVAIRQAEVGSPADAMEWLGTMPFASQWDYARVVDNVLTVWDLKDPTEAAEWLQKSTLYPHTLKSELQKTVQS
jgi:hypothetical protein